jgi:hypothetical protein
MMDLSASKSGIADSTSTANWPRPLCRIPDDSAEIAALADQFQTANPFPYVVLDNILNVTQTDILNSFPNPDWIGWSKWEDHYQAEKRYCGNYSVMPALMQGIISELSQPAFLRFVEQISGIDALIPDPHLEGGGLHSSGEGGILAPHTDFHLLERLNLYRQINIIIYLNPEWNEEWGGCLGLYKKGDRVPTQTVVPEFGRMVIFRTDHNSVHGFSVPVTKGHRRNSIALYYYTSRDAADFGGDTTTYWQQHGDLSNSGKVQLVIHEQLLKLSTFVSKAAHRFNPHVGNFRSNARKK